MESDATIQLGILNIKKAADFPIQYENYSKMSPIQLYKCYATMWCKEHQN